MVALRRRWLDRVSVEELEREINTIDEEIRVLNQRLEEIMRIIRERGDREIVYEKNMVMNRLVRLIKIRRGLENIVYVKKHRGEFVKEGIWRNLAKLDREKLILFMSTFSDPSYIKRFFKEMEENVGEE